MINWYNKNTWEMRGMMNMSQTPKRKNRLPHAEKKEMHFSFFMSQKQGPSSREL